VRHAAVRQPRQGAEVLCEEEDGLDAALLTSVYKVCIIFT
jgi:hypothetical protein